MSNTLVQATDAATIVKMVTAIKEQLKTASRRFAEHNVVSLLCGT